ncbi:MAG: arsenic transporter [Nevskiaceae bacterium]|nr:MAG: arsenic transporter [Nevskiaceae bacterium]TBR73087.1 MAG: arsenic transporter [Nevskiaceae bacterium]
MLALAIFLATLVLVVWQPRGLGIGTSALAGAAVALATGVVQPMDVAVVWHIVWDATFTFVALIIISLILDEAGCFEWAALHVARWGRGSGTRLFGLVVLLGAAVSAVFANDGAALLLTPIVLGILLRLEFPPPAAFAFALATGFIADTASLPLVTSNLVNIVSANYFGIAFDRYAAVMLPVNGISILATLAVLWLTFGRRIPRRYAVDALEVPASAIVDRAVFRATLPLLAALLTAWFALAPLHVPICFVTGAATLVLMAVAARRQPAGATRIPLRRVLHSAPWQIVLFSVGMYLVVYGLAQAGLAQRGTRVLEALAAHGPVVATVGSGFLAAMLAAVMNNLPATLIGALAIDPAHVAGTTRELMIYANVIGNDLGPKFTPIGSLATLLWLHVLAGRGVRIGWGQYLKVGLVLTPPVLLAALLTLAWWLPVISY